MSQLTYSNPAVTGGPTTTGTGNGTASIDQLTHYTIDQTYTLTCIEVSPTTIFSVSGSEDGELGLAEVGQQFIDADLKVALTITQGGTPFIVGDEITFTVEAGTEITEDTLSDFKDEILDEATTGSGTISNKTIDNTNTITVKDANFTVQDDSDVTKQFKFQASGITSGQTRTFTMPDLSDVLLGRNTSDTVTQKLIDWLVTSTATAAGTTTLTASSASVQKFTGTSTQNVVLPNATTLNNGHWYIILNGSTGALTLKDNGGNTLATIGANTRQDVYLISNSTSNGTWDTTATTPSTITIQDANFTLQDNLDTTKQAQFQLSGISTGTTRTYTLPNGDVALLGHNTSQLVSNKTIDSSNLITARDDNFHIVDEGDTTKRGKFQASGITTGTDRTYTLPNADGVMALNPMTTTGDMIYSASGSTASRLPVGTNGQVLKVSGGVPTWGASASGINYLSAVADAEAGTTGWALMDSGNTFTVTIASPAVFTLTSHNMSVGDPVIFSTTGALPTGLTAGTVYYVSSVVSANTFQVSATFGGSSVNTSGSQSGTHTIRQAKLNMNFWSAGSILSTPLLLTQSSSSPLRGSNSYLITQSNSTPVMGYAVQYPFTIDAADKAKKLKVSFDFNADSNFSVADGITAPNRAGAGDSDLEIWVVDATNLRAIPVTPQVITSRGSNNFTFDGTFQTSSDSTSYYLLFMGAKGSAGATGFQFKFENLFVGPQAVVTGVPVTDWTSYTPTVTGSSSNPTVTATGRYRRVGDSIEVNMTVSGSANGSGYYRFGLPSGLTIDTNKASLSTVTDTSAGSNTFGTLLGAASGKATGGVYFDSGMQVYTSDLNTGVVVVDGLHNVNTDLGFQRANVFGSADSFFTSGLILELRFIAPISGWSSNTQMSNDAETRVVAARLTKSGTQTINGETKITSFTVVKDSHSAFDTTNNRYVAPVSGWYRHSIQYSINAPSAYSVPGYKVNGGSTVYSGPNAMTSDRGMGQDLVYLTAGDYLEFNLTTSSSVTLAAGTDSTHFYIERLSGPSTLGAVELVGCNYGTTSTSALPTSDSTVVAYSVKEFDTHGAYNTSTGVYTVPVSGTYRLSHSVITGSNATSKTLIVRIRKNSTTKATMITTRESASSSQLGVVNTTLLKAVAGDTFDFVVWQNAAGDSFDGSASSNFITIERIGV